jgi:hypothetical protein
MSGRMASSRRFGAAILLGVAVLAGQGLLVTEAFRHDDPSSPGAARDAGVSGALSDAALRGGACPPQAFVSQEPVPLGTALGDASASSPARITAPVPPEAPGGVIERNSLLVSARIQEKYRSFRDSLRSP